MRIAPWVMLVAMCLCQPGCKMLGKRSAGAKSGGGADTAAAPRNDPVPVFDRTTPPTAATGFLAGQVIDSRNQHPPAATIQVVEAADPTARTAAPIEVPADGQGFFTIHGLQPGKPYLVTARVRDGSRNLAGTIVATPPDPRVLVRVAEDYAAPAPRPQPAPEKPGRSSDHANDPPQSANDKTAQEQKRGSDNVAPAGSNAPATERPAGPSSQSAPSSTNETRSEVRPENVVRDRLAKGETPSAFVPAWIAQERKTPAAKPQESPPNRETKTQVAAAAPEPKPQKLPDARESEPSQDVATAEPKTQESPAPRALPPAPVPSCLLVGNMLENLALNDLAGQRWDYRNRKGRMVLLNFWSTTDVPSLQALSGLNKLQGHYGPYGLEVVGIAYEDGTPLERIEKINRVRTRMHLEYLLLRGGDRKPCPVKTQFGVRRFPTFVLLDESGKIICQSEGNEVEHFEELEVIIRQRLTLR